MEFIITKYIHILTGHSINIYDSLKFEEYNILTITINYSITGLFLFYVIM